MKKFKKINLNINKEIVANLNNDDLTNLKGGTFILEPYLTGTERKTCKECMSPPETQLCPTPGCMEFSKSCESICVCVIEFTE